MSVLLSQTLKTTHSGAFPLYVRHWSKSFEKYCPGYLINANILWTVKGEKILSVLQCKKIKMWSSHLGTIGESCLCCCGLNTLYELYSPIVPAMAHNYETKKKAPFVNMYNKLCFTKCHCGGVWLFTYFTVILASCKKRYTFLSVYIMSNIRLLQ